MRKILFSIFILLFSLMIATTVLSESPSPPQVTSQNPLLTQYLASYDLYLKRMDIIVSSVVVVLAGLLGLNIYTSNRNNEIATKKLDELENMINETKIKGTLIDGKINELVENGKIELTSTIKKLEEDAKKQLIAISDNQYQLFYTKKAQNELKDMLSEDKPDENKIYLLLQEIINCFDDISIEIYSKCLKKFPSNKDIIRVVSRGLEDSRIK